MVEVLEERLPLTYFVTLALATAFILLFALWYLGILTPEKVFGNFIFVVFQLVAITTLAIVGAFILGMVVAHKILTSKRGFGPFETAMMEAHEDIKSVKKRLEVIEERLKRLDR